MEGLDDKISALEDRIDRLVRTQIDFQKEISALRTELSRLREKAGGNANFQSQPDLKRAPWPGPEVSVPPSRPRPPIRPIETPPPNFGAKYTTVDPSVPPKPDPVWDFFSKHTESARADLEKFIGENLISKIGILVLIIGIGIGVKYSIDNNLISPLTRIILAYLFAFGLIGLAIKLKPKYLNFSAALISGGMATMYFVTYFAYTAYGLIGQLPAFALMTLCTGFTVAAALFFNRQVIAHIGLVGAYAIPFLLSSDSGNYLALFIYMTIVNTGILAISVKKYWRPIFYTASIFTWFIFLGWFASKYTSETHFGLALTFLAVFFGIFLATKLVHAIVHNEHDSDEGLLAVIATVLVFYAFSFAVSAGGLSLLQTWNFFTYLAVVTAAIAILSFRFIGKAVVYAAFGSTWLIFGAWYLGNYSRDAHFVLASVFATAFFAIFYVSTLAHRLHSEEFSMIENSGLVLTNSFLFYGFGYSILNGSESTAGSLGLYTASHSALHLGVALIVGRIKTSAVDVVQVLTVLVLTFASIAIPVQFDGNQVTMAWAVEAAILFWFGRARSIRLFEFYSYPVMLLATASLFFDWGTTYFNRTNYISEFNPQPFANGNFVTALVYIAAFSTVYWVSRDHASDEKKISEYAAPFGYLIVGLAIFVLYNTFRLEIGNYFHLRAVELFEVGGEGSPAIRNNFDLNVLWQINYTLGFLAVMAFVNLFKIRSALLGYVNAVLSVSTLAVLATVGMALFYELRVSYLAGEGNYGLVSIRFVSYAVAAILLSALYLFSRDKQLAERLPEWASAIGFEAVVYSFCFIIASCELVNTMAQFGLPDATKLGLSIFWGVYALMLIVIGIARNRKHLRVAAIVLIGVTLVKLFFYDVADLDTIPRTILFVSLGLTLLVISFLYNKYKSAIFGLAGESEE